LLHVAFGKLNGLRGKTLANLVKFASGLGLGALLLTAACATSPSVSPEETAGRQARLAALSLLPDCADAKTVTGELTTRIPDCRMTARPSRLQLSLKSDPASEQIFGASGFLTISVIDRQGGLIAEFSEITNGEYAYPALQDVNGDGLDDLIIPRATDAVNWKYSLWLQQEGGDFVHAGEVTGSEVSWAFRGYVAAIRQTGAADWETGYSRIREGRLEEVALTRSTGVRAPGRDDPCEIIEIAPGLDPKRFCPRR
jgi:hypothetical protein